MPAQYWKNNEKREADPSRYNFVVYEPGSRAPRRYVNRLQCAAVFKKGKRAGKRCTRYALKDTIHCGEHTSQYSKENYDPARITEMTEGRKKWWERVHELEKTQPGLIRSIFAPGVEKRKKAKAAKEALQNGSLGLRPPDASDPLIVKGSVEVAKNMLALREVAEVPEKPYDELAPHEKMVKNIDLGLRVIYETMNMNPLNPDGTVNLKIVTIRKDTAIRTVNSGIKIDATVLKERRLDKMADIFERIKAGVDPKLIEGVATKV